MARKGSAAAQFRAGRPSVEKPTARQAKAKQAKGAKVAKESDGVLNPSLVPPSKRVKVVDEEAAVGLVQKKGEFLPAFERVRKEKLSHIEPLILKTRTDKDGLTVEDRVIAEQTKARAKNNYISISFWTQLYDDFGFKPKAFCELKGLQDGTEISDELLDAMAPAFPKI